MKRFFGDFVAVMRCSGLRCKTSLIRLSDAIFVVKILSFI